jgi:ABC-2 type transport system permease protein
MAGFADLEFYKSLGMSLGTFEDWVASILIALMPLVASIYAIGNGTGTLAGEEEDGRLEMMVTLPLPRWQVVTAKAAALVLSSFIIYLIVSAVSLFVFQSIESQIETDLVAMDMFKAVLSAWPLVFTMGMISMFLSAFCSSRRFASMISAVILIVSYFGNTLSNSTDLLDPFKPFFLFTYLDATANAVSNGQASGDVTVLLGIGLVAFLLALFFFQQRNLTVGAWPWQRAKIES